MRLWHLALLTLVTAVILSLASDPVGRVSVIVFLTGLGDVALGTTALLALFQTLGAIGEARGFVAHVEAIAATTVVLLVASALMTGWLCARACLVKAAVP